MHRNRTTVKCARDYVWAQDRTQAAFIGANMGAVPVRRLSERLARYIESPQVDVSVLTYASQRVWVTGATAQSASITLVASSRPPRPTSSSV